MDKVDEIGFGIALVALIFVARRLYKSRIRRLKAERAAKEARLKKHDSSD